MCLLFIHLLWLSVCFYLHSRSVFLLFKVFSFWYSKNIGSLSSGLPCFWWQVHCYSNYCPSTRNVSIVLFSRRFQDFFLFGYQQFDYIGFFCIYAAWAHRDSWIYEVRSFSYFGKFWPLFLHTVFLSQSFWPLLLDLQLHTLYPQVPEILFIFLLEYLFSLFFRYDHFYLQGY